MLCGKCIFSKSSTPDFQDVQHRSPHIVPYIYIYIYRVAQKKVYAFDLVQRKNYKCYIAEINVAVFIKV
jgi:hypothetical protein